MLLSLRNSGLITPPNLSWAQKQVSEANLKKNSWSEMHNRGIDVKLGAGLSFGGGNSGVSSQTTKETYECLRNSYEQFYIGSQLPGDGNISSWAQSVGQSPYPVQYTLTALNTLFSTNLIPGILQSDLNVKFGLFNDALNAYCSQYLSSQGCQIPTSDRPYDSTLSDSRCLLSVNTKGITSSTIQ